MDNKLILCEVRFDMLNHERTVCGSFIEIQFMVCFSDYVLFCFSTQSVTCTWTGENRDIKVRAVYIRDSFDCHTLRSKFNLFDSFLVPFLCTVLVNVVCAWCMCWRNKRVNRTEAFNYLIPFTNAKVCGFYSTGSNFDFNSICYLVFSYYYHNVFY